MKNSLWRIDRFGVPFSADVPGAGAYSPLALISRKSTHPRAQRGRAGIQSGLSLRSGTWTRGGPFPTIVKLVNGFRAEVCLLGNRSAGCRRIHQRINILSAGIAAPVNRSGRTGGIETSFGLFAGSGGATHSSVRVFCDGIFQERKPRVMDLQAGKLARLLDRQGSPLAPSGAGAWLGHGKVTQNK